MRLGKKGNFVGLAVIFSLIVVAIFWVAGLAQLVSDMGNLAVASGNVIGFEAFFFANLNLFLIIGWSIAFFATSVVTFSG